VCPENEAGNIGTRDRLLTVPQRQKPFEMPSINVLLSSWIRIASFRTSTCPIVPQLLPHNPTPILLL
jgi:hypothetical protein